MATDEFTGMSIGQRIRYWRERRGINQAALAGRVGRSKSWLCQIESEIRQLDSFSAILDLARELRVDPWDLTGHRGDLAPDGQQLHPAVSGIRAALDTVPGASDPDESPLISELTVRVRGTWDLWLTSPAHFDATGAQVPGLLAEAQTAVRLLDGPERREAQRQLALVYLLIRMFTKRVGSHRDALRAADRAVLTSFDIGDLPLIAASMWALAVSHSAMGEVEQAEDVARQGTLLLQPGLPNATPEHLSMWGQLHLIRAVTAARMKDKRAVWEHLTTAGHAGDLTGERNDFWTAFGPTNVAMHAVDAVVEMGEPGEALHIARDVDPSASPSVERRFSHEVEIASLFGQQHEDEACLFSLLRAEQISPHNARYSITMRELTRGLLRRESRLTHRAEARGLGHRMGVLTS